jgi:hypothetical protein
MRPLPSSNGWIVGQPEVADDRVVAFGAREEVGPLAVGRAVNRVAGASQGACKLL